MAVKLQNTRFLDALHRRPVDRTPMWIMRQAGRYLPEYRKVRAEAKTFLTLCKTPELACEVTLQPLERFPLDAAIIFSDILTIPDAMNLGLSFETGEGPKFAHPLRSLAQIEQLPTIDVSDDLRYVMDAVRVTTDALNGRVPLIGFSGSPWTLATYMVEGGSSKTFSEIKSMMYAEPTTLHLLLSKLARAVSDYLIAQAQAGASALMIFDTWGGVLSPQTYQAFSLRYMEEIVSTLKVHPDTKEVPVILFTKNGGQWLESIAATGCDAVGVDWTTSLADARARVGDRVALQGNLDPSILYADPDTIRAEAHRVLDEFGPGPGHVFNLGHGIHPNINPEHVAVLVDAVQSRVD